MKKYFIIWFFAVNVILSAQIGYKYEYKLAVYSNDNKFQKILIKACEPDETFEGSFSDNHLFYFMPVGKIQKGGFTFLDSDVYGWALDGLKKQWLKNNFTEIGMSTFPSTPEFMKAFSFQISALYDERKKDSLHVYFKYVIQSLKDSAQIHKSEFDLKTKVDYKFFVIPLNKELSLDFLSSLFKGYNFKLKVDYYREGERKISVDLNEAIVSKLKKSASESTIKDSKLNFDISFSRKSSLPLRPDEELRFLEYVNSNGLPNYSFTENRNLLFNEINGTKIPLYYCSYELPFALADKSKMEKYSKYKNSSKYLKSRYDLFIIPISITTEGIEADIIIDYAKLNLEDNFKRWTPVSKRVVIPYLGGIKIEIPKENWSANFTRNGEQYDIYGYPDYEKFIDEVIYISLRK
ncbi:MAG: hypothetical protein C0412_09075 [Flavobacterium sp.]|nr:hypothetical protein [Flavobacterium sp.]